MLKLSVFRNLICRHKYQLILTYFLFSLETLGNLLRFYFFGEAINGLTKGSYNGLIILATVHLVYLVVGSIRHIYDTRTYTAIYTSLVTTLLSRRSNKMELSRLSAHSTLAREFIDFLEQDVVYMIEAAYNLLGSLFILFFYDKIIVGICMAILAPVLLVSWVYGKKMNRLNKKKNDELEKQVDIISTGNKNIIHNHYSNLRKWQIKISNSEAFNFGFMELMVLLVIVVSLLLSKNIHNPAVLAGSLFGIYSYILKFASGLDTIPYIIQRMSSLNDIARRIELYEEEVPKEKEDAGVKPYNILSKEMKISA